MEPSNADLYVSILDLGGSIAGVQHALTALKDLVETRASREELETFASETRVAIGGLHEFASETRVAIGGLQGFASETRVAIGGLQEVASETRVAIGGLQEFASETRVAIGGLQEFASETRVAIGGLQEFASETRVAVGGLQEFATETRAVLVKVDKSIDALTEMMKAGFARSEGIEKQIVQMDFRLNSRIDERFGSLDARVSRLERRGRQA